MKKKFLIISLAFLSFNLTIKAQEINDLIEKILNAMGGREKFNAMNNIYKKGVLLEGTIEGEEFQANNDSIFTNVKEYFIPYVGIREEYIENKSKTKSISIFNTTNAWLCTQDINATNKQFKEIKSVPKYIYNSIYFNTKKYIFYKDLSINNYSTINNLAYDGYILYNEKRYIKFICDGVNEIYVDAETYLPFRVVEKIFDPKNKALSITEYFFKNYKMIDIGLNLPHTIIKQNKGDRFAIIYKYDLITTNVIEDAESFMDTKYITKLYNQRLENRKKGFNKPPNP